MSAAGVLQLGANRQGEHEACAIASRLLSTSRDAELRQRCVVDAKALHGGKNNRVYRVETRTAVDNDAGPIEPLLLKQYFRHPDDPRDRLATETAFLRVAAARGQSCLPRLVACDPAVGAALLSWLDGHQLHHDDVGDHHVRQAIDFVLGLNKPTRIAVSSRLHPSLLVASEACFSLDEHVRRVEQRIERLADSARRGGWAGASEGVAVDQSCRETQAFVEGALRPAWQRLRQSLAQHWRRVGVKAAATLSPRERCLSPSDFGFHNARSVSSPAGDVLSFHDFEYAGLDDPAKLVCDFYCQPQVPAPPQTQEMFVRALADRFDEPERSGRQATQLADRVRWLQPVYAIKWACICLNDMVVVDRKRRRFARGDDPTGSASTVEAKQFESQREKAAAMLRRAEAWHAEAIEEPPTVGSRRRPGEVAA